MQSAAKLTILSLLKLVENIVKKLSTPKSQVDNVMVPPEEIIKREYEVIAKQVQLI